MLQEDEGGETWKRGESSCEFPECGHSLVSALLVVADERLEARASRESVLHSKLASAARLFEDMIERVGGR